MMGWFMLLALLALPGSARAGTLAPVPASAPLACRTDRFTPEQNKRHAALLERVMGALEATTELADGYQWNVDQQRVSFAELTEWISLEGMCCPFFTFGVEWAPAGALRLRLTGEPAAKAVLQTFAPPPATDGH